MVLGMVTVGAAVADSGSGDRVAVSAPGGKKSREIAPVSTLREPRKSREIRVAVSGPGGKKSREVAPVSTLREPRKSREVAPVSTLREPRKSREVAPSAE
jgi:hypothetical protein